MKILTKYNDRRKYLLIAALLILIGFGLFFPYAYASHVDTLVREQAWEKRQDVNLLCGIIDKLVEMDEAAVRGYNYDEVLQFAVRYIEENYTSTFAQIFDEDLNPLTPLSPGVGGGQKHNPLDYPEFIAAVEKSKETNEPGSLVYWYKTPQAGGRYVHMCFRWVPSDADHNTRYLVAVGISKYTITESIDPRVFYGAFALIMLTAGIVIYACMMIIQLGYIYDNRVGDKWRPR